MVDLVPVDHEPEFTAADQAAMQPETFVPPLLSDWVKQAAPKDMDILKKTAQPIINAMMAPGQALASTTPIPSEQMIAPAMDMAGMTTLGAGAMPAEANSLRMGIKAYHGSPHDFDAFDLSKIGTGEGAQAYGHGLYFAENEGTAKSYRDALAKPSFATTREGAPISQDMQRMLDDAWRDLRGSTSGADMPGAIDAVDRNLQKQRADALKSGDMGWFDKVQDLRNEATRLRSAVPESTGKMYQVDINADPEHFLDWDKPLSADHPLRDKIEESAKAALDKATTGANRNIAKDAMLAARNENLTGQGAYQQLARTNTRPGVFPEINIAQPAAASKVLSEAGIPGIKYLDQGSRGLQDPTELQRNIARVQNTLANDPQNKNAADLLNTYQAQLADAQKASRNYVVFNDKLIDIIKKYGIAGLPAAGVAAGAMQSQPNPADMIGAIRGGQ